MERTEEEVKRQVEGLQKQRAKLPEFSGFGNPNWRAIDAQILIVQGKKDAEDYDPSLDVMGDPIEDDEDFRDDAERSADDHVYQAAQEADDWYWKEREEDLFDAE